MKIDRSIIKYCTENELSQLIARLCVTMEESELEEIIELRKKIKKFKVELSLLEIRLARDINSNNLEKDIENALKLIDFGR